MMSANLFAFFGWAIDATLKASVLVVLIAIAQRLIGNRIAARWRHALWLVVVVRLLLPAAPASRWSIFNLMPREERTAFAAVAAPRIVAEPARIPTGSVERASAEDVPVAWRWALGIWMLGTIGLLLRSVIAAGRLHFAIRREGGGEPPHSKVDELRALLNIRRRVRVVETQLVDAPALHGLFRPALLLPHNFNELFGRDELRDVVLHELWHLRRLDVAINWVLSVAEALHWFNPFVWFAVARIREERELACDELALSCLEEDERPGYGRTILKLLECFRTATPIPAAVGIVNHKKKMKRRILMIASYTHRGRVPLLFVGVLVIAGLAGLTDARGGERHMVMTKLDPASMETLEKVAQKRISVDLVNASFNDILSVVTNATGVTLAQSPAAASSPIQQAKFTVHAENIPVHLLLHSSLQPFKLAPKIDPNGVTIDAAGENDGASHIELHREMSGHGEGSGAGVEEHKTMTMRVTNDSKSTVSDDGTLHKEFTINIEENGVPSQGKLVLDIVGAPVAK